MSSSSSVYLQCVKEGKKLRIKIISSGYNNNANCQFPRGIRIEGRRYKVPSNAISVAGGESRGFFYRVSKNSIIILDDEVKILENLKIFATNDCVICLDDDAAEMVIIPCGHLSFCQECSKKINDTCPMCRGKIHAKIHKSKLR